MPTEFTLQPNGDIDVSSGTTLTVGTYSFGVTATDTNGAMDTATVTIDVVASNTPPVADDNHGNTVNFWETITITLTGSDVDGDTITFTPDQSTVANGTFTLVAGTTDQYEYDPDNTFRGMETITFVANDGIDDSAPATVEIDVINPFDDAVVSLSVVTDYNDSLSVDVIDVDAPTFTVTAGSDIQFEVNATLTTSWSDNYYLELSSTDSRIPYFQSIPLIPGAPAVVLSITHKLGHSNLRLGG